MKNGIYEATFTTSVGTLGRAAVLINGRLFAGADGMHFYRGEIDWSEDNDEVSVIMEVTRHNVVADSPLGRDPVFTLTWKGTTSGDETFRVSCEPVGSDLKIYVSGRLLQAFDD